MVNINIGGNSEGKNKFIALPHKTGGIVFITRKNLKSQRSALEDSTPYYCTSLRNAMFNTSCANNSRHNCYILETNQTDCFGRLD